MADHDRALSAAFDGQAEKFEVAPVQSDPAALARLVAFADLPTGARVLDAGCGPGLVSEAFLAAGCDVTGVDLSPEMIRRAQARNARFGERSRFVLGSLHDPIVGAPFDAAVSRYVLHHVVDPAAFVARQVELLRPGGVLVLYDHTTDPASDLADWHETIERLRDHTHTRNLTGGQIVDLLAAAGLTSLRLAEETFHLDFDEWFDRGTPAAPKDDVRRQIVDGPSARGFRGVAQADGSVRIDCVRVVVRGVKPGD